MKTSVYMCGYKEHVPVNFRLDKDVLILRVNTPRPVKLYYAPKQSVECNGKCLFKVWAHVPKSYTVTNLVAVCDPSKSSNFSFLVGVDTVPRIEVIREWVVQQYMYNYTYTLTEPPSQPVKTNTVPTPGVLTLLVVGFIATFLYRRRR